MPASQLLLDISNPPARIQLVGDPLAIDNTPDIALCDEAAVPSPSEMPLRNIPRALTVAHALAMLFYSTLCVASACFAFKAYRAYSRGLAFFGSPDPVVAQIYAYIGIGFCVMAILCIAYIWILHKGIRRKLRTAD